MLCCVMIDWESMEPESVSYKPGSKQAAATIKRRRHRMGYDADKVTQAENDFRRSLPRESLHRHSALGEDLYCPMNGVRVQGDQHRNSAVQNTPANLYRACSDETLSLQSHSRRLQHEAIKPTPTQADRRTWALDVASATRASHSGRVRHRRPVTSQPVTNTSSSRSRVRTVVNNRPDLLCTRKEHDYRNCVSPRRYGAADCGGQQHSSPRDDDPQPQHTGMNETITVTGTVPATTQSPLSVLSDSPGSLYLIAPAASPVTSNSVVFSPPPYTLVSSSTTAVWSTRASFQPRSLVMDSRSNPDSGYGSKIYRSQGTGPAVDPVTSCPEQGVVDTGVMTQSRVCGSFPDVVVDQPACHSAPVIPVATLPRTAFDHGMTSRCHHCQRDTASPPTNLDLVTYTETNLIVSPRHVDRRLSRVPIQLAEENSVDVSELLSPKSPLSLDSVDSVAEKVSDLSLSSPTNNVSVSTVPHESPPYQDLPQTTKCNNNRCDLAADDRLYCNVNSASETGNHLLSGRSLSSISEDARQASDECDERCQEDDYYCRSDRPAEEYITDAVDSVQLKDEAMEYQIVCDDQPRCLQIGRCTTV